MMSCANVPVFTKPHPTCYHRTSHTVPISSSRPSISELVCRCYEPSPPPPRRHPRGSRRPASEIRILCKNTIKHT